MVGHKDDLSIRDDIVSAAVFGTGRIYGGGSSMLSGSVGALGCSRVRINTMLILSSCFRMRLRCAIEGVSSPLCFIHLSEYCRLGLESTLCQLEKYTYFSMTAAKRGSGRSTTHASSGPGIGQ